MSDASPPPRRLSESDMLLLIGALGSGEAALSGWEGFLDRSRDLDVVDAGQFRLLPLVYRNLRDLGHSSAGSIGRLQGIYRQSWYRNRMAEARVVQAIDLLEQAGIDVMVLKGMAMVGLAYGDIATRPMNDADLYVHGRDVRRARTVLESNGWRLVLENPAEFGKFARLFHAMLYRHESGMELDLHRHLLEESNWQFADAGIWERSITTPLGGMEVRTPAPEDHLVHAIVHGSRWDPIPPLRWIADATLLLRRHTIRWDLVVSEAERRGVTLAVGAGLAFLREHFEAPIPEEPPRQLLERGHGVLERADFRFQQGGRGAAAQSARYVTRYLRLTRGKSPVVRLNLFPAYLRAMWGLESAWGLPREGTRRFVDRARGREPLPRVRPIPE